MSSMPVPINYQFNEKKKICDVLGREIDTTVQSVMRNESRYTPLKEASKYIMSDGYYNPPKYNNYIPSTSNSMEIHPRTNNTFDNRSMRNDDYDNNARSERNYGTQPNREEQQQQGQPQQVNKANYQPIRQYQYSEIKSPNSQHYNYYDHINSKNELRSRMINNNNASSSSYGEYNNLQRPNNNYDERYYNNNYNNDNRYSDGNQYDNPYSKGSNYYYAQNIPKGPGLRDVPSNVYIPCYQPYKPGSTPLDKGNADYKKSRFGDYTYNFYLNSPMRGNITEDWRYPPKYYYNARYDPRTYYYQNR